MRRRRSEKWHTYDWVLHHDNARLHAVYIIQELLAENKMAVVPHPLYLPDLAPSKMKIKLKGQRFDTVEEIQVETQMVLKTQAKKHFEDVFQKWQKHWDQYVHFQGDSFEGDGAE
jgi:hypothetical protein